jgi:hypothetical protein
VSGFAATLREFAKATNRTMTQTLTGAVLELGTRMVVKSPVDTGRFRGQWQIGDGGPDTRTDSPFDKKPLGSPPGPETFARWQDQLEGVLPGTVIYITNSLPYARRLEYGYSQRQAPTGVVRVTITEWQQIVETAIKKAKK